MNGELSAGQRRLWFLDRLDPGSPVYNVPFVVRWRGPLDVAVLRRCLVEIVRRHEVLRTSFVLADGQVRQRVGAVPDLEVPVLSLAGQDLAALLAQEARRPFDLERGPMMRCAVVRVPAGESVVMVTFHHVACDGWSMGVFRHELSVLYAAFLAGRPSPLPVLPIQYRDYAAWQADRWQSGALAGELAYWEQQLAGAPARLALPVDRAVAASSRGAMTRADLGAELADGLRALARREGVTLFMTLLAGFSVLLARYTGQREVVVGTAVAGRGHPELTNLIGFYVNTLVLRMDIVPDAAATDLLAHVREVCTGAYAHQELPFDRLVEHLRPHRDPATSPLFHVFFATADESAEVADHAMVRMPTDGITGTTKFDLAMEFASRGAGIEIRCGYRADLFQAATVARMLDGYRRLLRAMVADTTQRVAELTMLSRQEWAQAVTGWNATQAEYPRHSCLHQLVAEQAARAPDAVAVVCGDEQVTYRQLSRTANQLAWYLRDKGVRPESLVGVCVPRSVDTVAGLLAVLKTGAAYLPLDPSHPAERLAFMVRDAAASVVLTVRSLRGKFAAHDTVVCLDEEHDLIRRLPVADPEVPVYPRNLAYVIYTSGSTGVPKGVMVHHRALVNRLCWGQRAFRLDAGDGCLHKAPLSFDAAVWEMWWPLTAGARLVLAPVGTERDYGELRTLMLTAGVTVAHFTPSALRQALGQGALRDCGLRHVFCGGEVLPRALRDQFRAQVGASLHNGYGPTETTCNASYWTCPAADDERPVPIGHPLANVRIYILGPSLEPVPIGVAGEVYIGGDGVARGYAGRPALTADRFVPEAFGDHHGSRLYRTGDVARRRPDGAIEFVGRVDEQLNVRGCRIEPAEVEAIVQRHPSVGHVAVVAQPGPGGDVRLVCRLTASPASALRPDELRQFVASQAPEYLVPSLFQIVEQMPMTASGKIDRRAVASLTPVSTATPSAVTYAGELERGIAAVWSSALEVPQVGLNDNFFDLGGHSVLLTQVHATLRDSLGLPLSLVDMYTYPTISALATYVSGQRAAQRTGDNARP